METGPGNQTTQELRLAPSPAIRGFFDEATNSVSYLVADPATRTAVVIDPVLGFDMVSGRIDTENADRIANAAAQAGCSIGWILETHAHADHLSAADYLKRRLGAKVAIGSGIRKVQAAFAAKVGADDVKPDGGDFDRLLEDGDTLALGELKIEVIATPGHTPACVSYKIGDAVFVGDTIYAESEVLDKRESKSRPGQGIVTVRTRGLKANGMVFMEFERSIILPKRAGSAS